MFKLTIKTPERRQRRRSRVFLVNFEHISLLFLVFLLLSLNQQMLVILPRIFKTQFINFFILELRYIK